jgi:hypothetical protein
MAAVLGAHLRPFSRDGIDPVERSNRPATSRQAFGVAPPMTDDIDAEAEALARYESGLPLASNVGKEPAPSGTITSEGPEGSQS